MKSVQAQCWINIDVQWDDNCPQPPSLYNYQVTLEITKICPSESLVYLKKQIVWPPLTNADFCIQQELCTIDQAKRCYRVKILVEKILISTGEVLCSEELVKDYNCEELIGLNGIPQLLTLN
jgi:hypothetical protein